MNINSGAPTFFTYFTTNNYAPPTGDPDWILGYNAYQEGFCQWSSTVFPGTTFASTSVFNGTQVDLQPSIQYLSEADSPNGVAGWWIAAFSIWVGYYPKCRSCSQLTCDASVPYLFAETGMREKASDVAWYGEVFDSIAPQATVTDMGSGKHATMGYRNAAYIRNVQLMTPVTAPPFYDYQQNVPGNLSQDVTDNCCYMKTPVTSTASGTWSNFMFLGGSGASEPMCN